MKQSTPWLKDHKWPDKIEPNTLVTTNDKIRFINYYDPEKKNPYIQFIRVRFFSSVEEALDSFDFTVSMVGYDPKTDEVVLHPMAMDDILNKRLVVHRVDFPTSTLQRLCKYTKRGYSACYGSLAALGALIQDAFIRNPESGEVYYLD